MMAPFKACKPQASADPAAAGKGGVEQKQPKRQTKNQRRNAAGNWASGQDDSSLAKLQQQGLTPEAIAICNRAAAVGLAVVDLSGGKGSGKKGTGKGVFRTLKVASPGPNGVRQPVQQVVREGGKPAVMKDGKGKTVPIAWVCSTCHFPTTTSACHTASIAKTTATTTPSLPTS